MKKIVPVNDQVLIRRMKPETQSKIARPDGYQDSKYAIGEVVAVGPGNDREKPPCKVEDAVIFWVGQGQKEDNPVSIVEGYGDCIMVDFEDIFAVVE